MNSSIRKLPTGVPGLDILTYGGIPEGRSTLVVGRSGTGKTILGLQTLSHLARIGTPGLLLAVEEAPDDLIVSGDSLGLDLSGLIASGKLQISDVTQPMEGPVMVSGEYDISGLVHRIQSVVNRSGARVVVLDSATALFSPRPAEAALRNLFFQLVYALRKMDLTALILAEAPADYGERLTTLGVEDYVCDAVIVLRNTPDGQRRRRSIEVNKYRRSPHYKGEYPSTITSRGLAIFPLDAEDLPLSEGIERYSSGFPGLDEMLGGGLVRDSINLVRGPTGSGKTMLAGLYASAGARRGERVVYYGFEEPRPMLLRNFAQIGMEMEEYEKAGTLQLICRYPEASSLEDLLVGFRMHLEEFNPSLIVLDSISSIEHACSEKGFRQFMIGVAALLRKHGRSALLTQTVTSGDAAADQAAPYLSTIADAILRLDYSAQEYELQRSVRVIKVRGGLHDTHPYRLTIGQGGLFVEKMPPPWGQDRRGTDAKPRSPASP
jgi:circadian clock protein KaiC